MQRNTIPYQLLAVWRDLSQTTENWETFASTIFTQVKARKAKARFRRRSTHVPNLIQLGSTLERHTVYFIYGESKGTGCDTNKLQELSWEDSAHEKSAEWISGRSQCRIMRQTLSNITTFRTNLRFRRRSFVSLRGKRKRGGGWGARKREKNLSCSSF